MLYIHVHVVNLHLWLTFIYVLSLWYASILNTTFRVGTTEDHKTTYTVLNLAGYTCHVYVVLWSSVVPTLNVVFSILAYSIVTVRTQT